MFETVQLILIGLIVLVIVLPLLSFIKSRNALEQSRRVGEDLTLLQRRLEIIGGRLLQIERGAPRTAGEPAPRPVVEAENQPDLAARPRRTEIPEPSPLEEPAEPLAEPQTVVAETIAEPLPELPLPMARPPQKAPAPDFKLPALNLEQFMGVKLFAWLGGLALFSDIAFAASFLYQRYFDRIETK